MYTHTKLDHTNVILDIGHIIDLVLQHANKLPFYYIINIEIGNLRWLLNYLLWRDRLRVLLSLDLEQQIRTGWTSCIPGRSTLNYIDWSSITWTAWENVFYCGFESEIESWILGIPRNNSQLKLCTIVYNNQQRSSIRTLKSKKTPNFCNRSTTIPHRFFK